MREPSLNKPVLEAITKKEINPFAAVAMLNILIQWEIDRYNMFDRELKRGQRWAEEHEESDAGTFYTDDLPRMMDETKQRMLKYMRLKTKIQRMHMTFVSVGANWNDR